jgi:hypothetical protein
MLGIALVVVAVLIWFPFTGFFLTTLTLGLLPSLICKLFLIHLAYAAVTKSIPLGWLIAPIACYGTKNDGIGGGLRNGFGRAAKLCHRR